MDELVYTSAPRGLAPGTNGYTVVARTAHMEGRLVQLATGLSSHAPLDATNPRAHAAEPVNWVHLVADQGVHVVSRIGACAPDHTNRSNFVAHHLLLSTAEARTCPAGPAELLALPNLLEATWTGEPKEFAPRTVPTPRCEGPTSTAFSAVGLDPGWAEALADRLRDRAVKETWLVYPRGMDMLPLVRSVLSHLSPEERWAATFTTLATRTFPGMEFPARLRCVVSEMAYAKEVLAKDGAFDLTNRPAPPPRRRPTAAEKPAAGVLKGNKVPGTHARPDRPSPLSNAAQRGNVNDQVRWPLPHSAETPFPSAAPAAPPSQPILLSLLPWALAAVATVLSCFVTYLWKTTHDKLTLQQATHAANLKSLAEEHKIREAQNEREIAKLKLDNEALGTKLANKSREAQNRPLPTQEESPPPAETASPGTVGTANNRPSAVSENATSPLPAEGTSGGNPTLVEGAVESAKRRPQKPIDLITGLSGFSVENIEIMGTGTNFIDSSLQTVGKKRQLKINGKMACKFELSQDKSTLELTVMEADPLLRFLTVRVSPDSDSPIEIPLGRPFPCKMSCPSPEAVDAGSSPNDLDRLKKEYSIFSGDGEAEIVPAAVGIKKGDFFSVIAFQPDALLLSGTSEKPGNVPLIPLTLRGDTKRGVIMQPSRTNAFSVWTIMFDDERAMTVQDLAEKWVRLNNQVDIAQKAANSLQNRDDQTARTQLADAKNQFDTHKDLVSKAVKVLDEVLGKLKELPVRWTLALPDPQDHKKPDVENELVIVDSLKDSTEAP